MARDEPDEALMTRVRDGEVDRLGELFDRRAGLVLAYFRRRAATIGECEDLVQETFLRALKYRRSWRGEGTFLGWLFRLAVNVERDRRGRARRRAAAFDASVGAAGSSRRFAADGVDPAASAPDEDALVREEEAARLHAALARMRPEERALLELKWFDGLDAREIGIRIGCTPGAARVRLHRAHLRLRELHGEE